MQTFINCLDPAHLALLLEDERILVELIQLAEDLNAEGTVLAHFYEPAKDFLYPQNTLMSAYSDSEREVLMQRTLWFSVRLLTLGISVVIVVLIKLEHIQNGQNSQNHVNDVNVRGRP